MIFPRKSIAILLIITLGMGPLHAATTPSKTANAPKLLPQEKQKLLDRLIMRFKATMKPIHLGPHQHFPPEIQKKVRAERRRIVKEAVAYGLGTALVLALAALGYVALKGRGQGVPPIPSAIPFARQEAVEAEAASSEPPYKQEIRKGRAVRAKSQEYPPIESLREAPPEFHLKDIQEANESEKSK